MPGSAFMPSAKVTMAHVTFDRPFGFLAADRETGLVLVAGWVADAEPANPEQAVQW
jgi:serine protease inhibitor